jgi:hypothetical protein
MLDNQRQQILKKILDLKLKRQTTEIKLEIQRLQQLLEEED